MVRLLRPLLLLLTALLPAAAMAQQKGPLVLAAASLQESLTDAANRWTAKGHPKPVISFASSSALAKQVESGAPADIFISADTQWMDYLAGKGLIRPETRKDFLVNSLVLVAPRASTLRLHIGRGFPLARALNGGRLAMGDPDAVPAGRYGKAALTALGVWPSVEASLARAESVRAALALVERGEAPLGIVYATDARASGGVRVVGTFPAASHPLIVYPLATLTASRHADAAGFRRFLLSTEGKAVFRNYGFGVR